MFFMSMSLHIQPTRDEQRAHDLSKNFSDLSLQNKQNQATQKRQLPRFVLIAEKVGFSHADGVRTEKVLQKYVDNLTKIFKAHVENPAEIDKAHKKALACLLIKRLDPKKVERLLALPVFLEYAKRQAYQAPQQQQKPTGLSFLPVDAIQNIVSFQTPKEFAMLQVAMKDVRESLDVLRGQNGLIQALFKQFNFDIEKLKEYIGEEGYEKVFNSITTFNCDGLGKPITLTLLNHFPKVQTLSLTCDLNEMLIQTLTGMKELTSLKMTTCVFENSSQLRHIFQMDTLRQLHLSGNLHFLVSCVQYLQGSKLEKLSLIPHSADSVSLAFDAFPVLSNLRELDLTHTGISTEALNKLQLPELQKLKLMYCNNVTDLTLPELPKLQYVDPSWTDITSDALKTLHTKNILGLNLVGCQNTRSLDFLSSMPQLEQIDLNCIDFIKSHTSSLPGSFPYYTSLRFLNVRYCKTDSVQDFEYFENLEELHIKNCSFKIFPIPNDVEKLLKALPRLKKFSIDVTKPIIDLELDDPKTVEKMKKKFPHIEIAIEPFAKLSHFFANECYQIVKITKSFVKIALF